MFSGSPNHRSDPNTEAPKVPPLPIDEQQSRLPRLPQPERIRVWSEVHRDFLLKLSGGDSEQACALAENELALCASEETELAPYHARARFDRGASLIQLGRFCEAAEDFLTASKLFSEASLPGEYSAACRIYAAESRLGQRDYEGGFLIYQSLSKEMAERAFEGNLPEQEKRALFVALRGMAKALGLSNSPFPGPEQDAEDHSEQDWDRVPAHLALAIKISAKVFGGGSAEYAYFLLYRALTESLLEDTDPKQSMDLYSDVRSLALPHSDGALGLSVLCDATKALCNELEELGETEAIERLALDTSAKVNAAFEKMVVSETTEKPDTPLCEYPVFSPYEFDPKLMLRDNLTILRSVVRSYVAQGKFEQAEDYAILCLNHASQLEWDKSIEEVLRSTDPEELQPFIERIRTKRECDTLSSIRDLGDIQAKLSRPEAYDTHLIALKLTASVYGEESSMYGEAMNRLAHIQLGLFGQPEEAMANASKALDLFDVKTEEGQILAAESYSVMSFASACRNDFQKSASFQAKRISLLISARGAEHDSVLAARLLMIDALMAVRQEEAASDEAQLVYSILEERPENCRNKSLYACAMAWLASFKAAEHPAAAEELFVRAEGLYESLIGSPSLLFDYEIGFDLVSNYAMCLLGHHQLLFEQGADASTAESQIEFFFQSVRCLERAEEVIQRYGNPNSPAMLEILQAHKHAMEQLSKHPDHRNVAQTAWGQIRKWESEIAEHLGQLANHANGNDHNQHKESREISGQSGDEPTPA